ncbi:nucleotide sugar dehydrogenase [Methanococcus maripaludis]|uniref:UDP-N-acetyl-D-mannosamine dehydrogenase n=1 Tax=Methanococcus maripaludis TaxID=39152 RepID=A0A7J9NUL9_METMI|nr:nucleotide sugar dehydrogenase [Methanococcus maripaludis]MBA2851392.1 nucleotide sugar dehydrogenase [Methanococcus maripaludis]
MNELGNLKIAVFGQGKMGLPLASVFAEYGINVIGVDINQMVVDNLNNGINHITEEPGLSELVSKNVETKKYTATTDGVSAATDADIMVILVPTLIDDRGNIKLDPVYSVSEIISKGLKKGNIVITEATMPPGTTEKLIPILEKSGLKLGEFGLAHAPERTMTGTALRDIKGQYPKIIGCNDENTYQIVSKLYNLINKKGTIQMSSIKAAETVKVFEGVYRDVNIGLSNEMALWCEEHEINALEVFEAANTQPFCHFHTPGAGVGGHCIPVYPWFVINTSNEVNPRITKTARELNDYMAHHIVELTIKGLNELKKCLNGSNVLVLGLTFRGGVKEFMKSAAIPIINELNSFGANVYSYDPLCDESDFERFNSKLKTDFNGIDAIIVTSDHEEFKYLDFEKISKEVSTKLIVDGRNIINISNATENGFRVIKVGNLK